MTATTTRSARNRVRDPRAGRVPCVHADAGCTYTVAPGETLQGHVSMCPFRPAVDELSCVGSNHVPGCAHFTTAPGVLPSASGAVTTDPTSRRPRVASASAGETARDAASSEPGVPAAAIAPSSPATLTDLPLDLLDVGDNVRVEIEDLEELAASIAEHGVLQPIKATGPHADGRYLVTWGQRRTLASRQAGRAAIPAIVLPPEADVDRHGAARSIEQLVENLHRKDLPALDRARAMREVVDAGTSQADLARKLGVDPSTIANSLRLLELDDEVQRSIAAGLITAAHGKALVGLAPATQRELTKRAASEGASAHRMEALVADHKRTEEWRRTRAAEERRQADLHREAQERAIATMAKKRTPLDAPIHVGGGYYGDKGAAGRVAELVRKAGYTNVRVSDRSLPGRPAGYCDCIDWRIETSYSGGLTIARACSKADHQRAKAKADEDARVAAYDLQRRVRARVEQSWSRGQVAVSPYAPEQLLIDEQLARMLLWELLGYGVADWAAAHGFKRNQPWQAILALSPAELAAEIRRKVAHDFRDNYGYHVDWVVVAGWIGIDAEDPS